MSYSDPMAEIKARAYAESVRQSFAPQKDNAMVTFASPTVWNDHCEGFNVRSLAHSIVAAVMLGSGLDFEGHIVNGYGGEDWRGNDIAIDDDRMATLVERGVRSYRYGKESAARERLQALIQDGRKREGV